MHPATARSGSQQSPAVSWLEENGPRELELLFRAIVFHPAAPVLIVDNDRNYREASTGAGKLLGLPREKIIGRKFDDFADPASQSANLGALEGISGDGRAGRHSPLRRSGRNLAGRGLHGQRERVAGAPCSGSCKRQAASSAAAEDVEERRRKATDSRHGCRTMRFSWWMSTDGLSPGTPGLNASSAIPPAEAIGQHVSFLHPSEDDLARQAARGIRHGPPPQATSEMKAGGPKKTERDSGPMPLPWRSKTKMEICRALPDVVRDFSDRHERDEKLRRSRARSPANRRGIDHRRCRFR